MQVNSYFEIQKIKIIYEKQIILSLQIFLSIQIIYSFYLVSNKNMDSPS
jgi:hypothetical protein